MIPCFVLIGALLSADSESSNASDGCLLLAEITVTAVCDGGAMAACLTSGNPVACEVALLCDAVGKAGREITKRGLADGCRITVERVGPKLRILIDAGREAALDMERAFDVLKDVKGLHWLRRQLP